MRTFRVGIDGSVLTSPMTGVGRYVYYLCQALNRLEPEWDFVVYHPKGLIEKPVVSDYWQYVEDQWVGWRRSVWLKARGAAIPQNDKLDVYWAPAFVLPGFVRPKFPTVLTVHDLVTELYPETVPCSQRIRHRLFIRRDVRNATRLISVSQGTAHKLERFYGRKSNMVIPPASGEEFYRRGDDEVSRFKKTYEIDGPFILLIGSLEPRKNIEAVLDAFIAAKEKGYLNDYSLIHIGGDGWLNERLKNKFSESQQYGVKRLGYVASEWLPAAYSAAATLVFPSLYEGFGMPIREALMCGTPVICTDSEEMREAGGEYPTYVKNDTDSIFAALSVLEPDRPMNVTMAGWEASAKLLRDELLAACKK